MSDFITAWETLFGIYTPITIQNLDGTIGYLTDWGYVMRCAFFIIIVFCIFKLIGGVFKDGKR